MSIDARVADPRRRPLRVCGVPASTVAHVRHGAGEDAQAAEDVPPDLRDFDATHRHLGQGPAAHHGVRVLRNSVALNARLRRDDVAAQDLTSSR